MISEDKSCAYIICTIDDVIYQGQRISGTIRCVFYNEMAEKIYQESIGQRMSIQGEYVKSSYLVGKCDVRKEELLLWAYIYEKIN